MQVSRLHQHFAELSDSPILRELAQLKKGKGKEENAVLAKYRIAQEVGQVASARVLEFFQSDAGQALIKRVPQRRLGQLTELDGPLLLLLSNAGSFMTGSVVTVDGGHMVSGL